jgi:hypothetical protein
LKKRPRVFFHHSRIANIDYQDGIDASFRKKLANFGIIVSSRRRQ